MMFGVTIATFSTRVILSFSHNPASSVNLMFETQLRACKTTQSAITKVPSQSN